MALEKVKGLMAEVITVGKDLLTLALTVSAIGIITDVMGLTKFGILARALTQTGTGVAGLGLAVLVAYLILKK